MIIIVKVKWCYICRYSHNVEDDCFTLPEKIKLQKALQKESELDELGLQIAKEKAEKKNVKR